MVKILFSMLLAFSGVSVFAAESATENVNATANDAKRGMKKAGHKVSEAVCMKSDAECLARKAKNRATEGKDYVKDKASEAKDKIDADGNAAD